VLTTQSVSNRTLLPPGTGIASRQDVAPVFAIRSMDAAGAEAVRQPQRNGDGTSTSDRAMRTDRDPRQQRKTQQEQRQIQELKARDREVRSHEQAHRTAGAGLVRGGTSFTLVRGPDGRQYAVGGEVSIDTSPVRNDPEATLRKAQQIRRSALAPAEPSPQDRAVAAQAASMEQQARSEITRARLAASQAQADTGTEAGTDPATAVQPALLSAAQTQGNRQRLFNALRLTLPNGRGNVDRFA